MRSLDSVSKDMKILVVDDYSTMRRIVKNILQQLGFTNVDEAEDGAVALSKLRDSRFDFVISDWNMPNMMGIELLKAARSSADLKDIPFLMVTAEAQKENVVDAVEQGVANYIIKPFTADTLGQKLATLLSAEPA
jgi:two-component system, chemotaxis family, chemotaxis protein CheY